MEVILANFFGSCIAKIVKAEVNFASNFREGK
jgi:hypothetical protein